MLVARYFFLVARYFLLVSCHFFVHRMLWKYKIENKIENKLISAIVTSAKIRELKRSISPTSFLWATARLLVTRVSLMYLVDKFFIFSLLVLLKEKRQRSYFCVCCKLRELGPRGSPRFPCVTPVVVSFFSDLLQTIISYWAESHLECCQTFTMELSSENNPTILTSRKFPQKSSTADIRPDSECVSDWRCCQYGVWVDCKCMEFVVADWCKVR